jgi:mono/diheme cytochrome c family protein
MFRSAIPLWDFTMSDFLVLATSIRSVALLVSIRPWPTKNNFVKWCGKALGALFSAVGCLMGFRIIVGLLRLNGRTAPIPDIMVAGTPEQVVRGQVISNGCHLTTSPVKGGFYVGGNFSVPIGLFGSSNLTPAGELSYWSDGEIFRAIRNGVDRDGRWLIIMSYTNARKLSNDDTWAVIAYLRSLPPAGKPTEDPPDSLNLLGVMMLGANMLPRGWPVSTDIVTAPPEGPTLRYAGYLLSYQDCRTCHGDKLTGGVPGQAAPLAPDLSVVKRWKFQEFVATTRTGVDPNGHELNRQMPWRLIGRMGDEELRAIYEYLTHMPSAEDQVELASEI